MKRLFLAPALAVAVLAAAACSGGSAVPGGASSGALEWGQEQLGGAAFVGPANVDHLEVNVVVRQQNASGLLQYARGANNPASPLYRQFLTPQQIADRFGASAQDYHNAAQYFASRNLSVGGWPQRLTLAVAGSQSNVERAFGTHFGVYRKNGEEFIAPMSAPQLPAAIPVVAAANLVTYDVQRRDIVVPPRVGNNAVSGYAPQQVQAAFDYTGAYKTVVGGSALNGTGINVGIIGTGPIDVIGGQDQDAATLATTFRVRMAPIAIATVTPSGVAAGLKISGIPTAPPSSPSPNNPPPNPNLFPFSADFQSPPPVTSPKCTGPLPTCNPEDVEAQLDTQQIASLAPGSNVMFYLAYNASDCHVYFPNSCAPAPPSPPPNSNYGQPLEGLLEADAEIQQAIADDKADVISISWGGGEPENIGGYYTASGSGYGPEEFAALAAEGIAVFASSGDTGSAGCFGNTQRVCVQYPASDPSVTAVGGVNAPIDELGQFEAPITAWGTTTATNGGLGLGDSGGGVSTIFPAIAAQASTTGATMREVPDLAMLADPNTGVFVAVNSRFGGFLTGEIGGTSVAAPQSAAMWALVLEACKNTHACATAGGPFPYRLGNAAPLIYGIYGKKSGTGSPPAALPYPNVFYDVVYGQNPNLPGPGPANTPNPNATPVPGYVAGAGYDEVTGVGVPFAGHLIQAITGQAVP
ncbi:MAG TPA: protease pro-enzyme activation domain-containing protein [Candidatus Baltobacteraceae bacterium]|jgi:subtilase family serine protease|nr:protease pro-enzyme activation domain-containing protein [Candidatus Baltobacteraceae bacterium]